MDLPEITLLEIIARLALAAGLGAVVGLEREWRDRTAGLRTHMLVCIGSAAFTIISAYGFVDWYQAFEPGSRSGVVSDPTRIAAQIVSGIGFLGAGAIFRSDDGIKGLTTAASLWAMAAIGLAAGAGQYEVAIATTAIIMFVLTALRTISGRIKQMNRAGRVNMSVVVEGARPVAAVFEMVANHGGSIGNLTTTVLDSSDKRELIFEVMLLDDNEAHDLVGQLTLLPGVSLVTANVLSQPS